MKGFAGMPRRPIARASTNGDTSSPCRRIQADQGLRRRRAAAGPPTFLDDDPIGKL